MQTVAQEEPFCSVALVWFHELDGNSLHFACLFWHPPSHRVFFEGRQDNNFQEILM